VILLLVGLVMAKNNKKSGGLKKLTKSYLFLYQIVLNFFGILLILSQLRKFSLFHVFEIYQLIGLYLIMVIFIYKKYSKNEIILYIDEEDEEKIEFADVNSH